MQIKQKAEREGRERFFNRPGVAADYSHWSKASHWSLDEAVAPSFGRAPEYVSWKNVGPYTPVSPFAVAYGRLRDLVLRTQTMGQLFEPAIPGFYLACTKRNGITYPAELENAVKATGILVADWKTRYESFMSERDMASAQLALATAQLDAVEAKIATLRMIVGNHETHEASEKSVDRPLAVRERENLLRLVIGIAVNGYSYNPEASRNVATAEIGSDLDNLGLSLDSDTIRKWLKEAAELLPR